MKQSIEKPLPIGLDLSKKQRGKTSFKEFDIRLETEQRPDVVLKTILRSIRRHYIALFNKKTNYIKCKRGKGPEYFIEQLKAFVDLVFSGKNERALKQRHVQWLGTNG